ncbi:hypothetical protein [Biformimicrobium ophioploci]|uniref:DUF2306 domain-containing protein n=1 Tax=Biformimicrobium ophioploci TaxID=3036711 RepID=A0ABQ6LUP4_9GAMM|nr:hypothetical protein [Microbulbifer sp. NKW57]GMG85752.1 hypothetical protein MNKW57_00730 [Microbulbifer sp. NKW57]
MSIDFYQVNVWLHILFGTIALFGAVTALWVKKGSKNHVKSGTVFAWLMGAVCITSLITLGKQFIPPVLVLSTVSLYLILTGVICFSKKYRQSRPLAIALLIPAIALLLFTATQSIRLNLASEALAYAPIVMAAMLAALVYDDVRMLLTQPSSSRYWLRRHLSRMILAFAVATEALLRLGTDLGIPQRQRAAFPVLIAVVALAWMYKKYPPANKKVKPEAEQQPA